MEELTNEQIEQYENELLKRAKDWWYQVYPHTEATDLEKLRIYSKEGLVVGKLEHDIKKRYYKEQGFWEDGKTTLEERVRQLRLEKIDFGKKINQLQNAYTENLDEIVKNIEEKKKQIEQVPFAIKKEYGIERKKVIRQFREELEKLKETYLSNITEELEKIYVGMITDFEIHKSELILKIKTKLDTLHYNSKQRIENEINEHGAELEAELTILDASKQDDELLKKYNEEVKQINQQINELRGIDGEIQEPQVKLKLETPPVKEEIWKCQYCLEEEGIEKTFKNRGGLGSHIKYIHGEEKYEEYKNPKETQEVIVE